MFNPEDKIGDFRVVLEPGEQESSPGFLGKILWGFWG